MTKQLNLKKKKNARDALETSVSTSYEFKIAARFYVKVTELKEKGKITFVDR